MSSKRHTTLQSKRHATLKSKIQSTDLFSEMLPPCYQFSNKFQNSTLYNSGECLFFSPSSSWHTEL